MLESQRGEKLRHAMSGLLVEILTPVSAVIKYEAYIPAVRKLVQTLYLPSYEHSKRQRHSLVSQEAQKTKSLSFSHAIGIHSSSDCATWYQR